VAQSRAIKGNVSGDFIRKFRIDRGLSQERLAASAQLAGYDLSRNTIAKIETQARTVTDSELMAFAKLLNVEPCQLLPRVHLATSTPDKEKK
jgi:transcriptional regulator with XRE-family HTH domain